MANKCKRCVRYNPKAVSNCTKQQSVYNLGKRLKVKLEVADCAEYLAPEKVFKEPKPKAKKKKREVVVTFEGKAKECDCEDFTKYGDCECEG